MERSTFTEVSSSTPSRQLWKGCTHHHHHSSSFIIIIIFVIIVVVLIIIVIIVYILWQWFPTGGDPRKQEAKVHLLCPPMNLEGSSSEESVLQWAKSGLFVKVYHSVLLLRGLGNDKGRCGKVLSNFCCWHKWVSAENLFPRRKGFHLFPVCPSKHVDDGNIFRGFLMGFMKEKREMGFCRKLRQWASLSLLMQSQTPHWLLKGPEHF